MASNGTASANTVSTIAVSWTSSASNRPPPRSTSIASGPDDHEADRREHRQHPDRERVPADLAAEPAAVARRPRGGQARERRERDRHAQQRHRHALEVARERHGRDAAGDQRRRDGGEEQERQRLDRVADHLGQHQAEELAQGGHPQVQARADAHGRVPHADDPDAQVEQAPITAPTAAALIPIAVVEQQRPAGDAEVVQDRREGVVQELALGHEHLAQGDRGPEDDRRHQHQPEQVEVAGPGSTRRSRGRPGARSPGRGSAAAGCDADITMTASVRTVWANRGAASAAWRASEVNTGHERRREPGRHEHVEGQLREHERRVVGVELRPGPVGPGEQAVPHAGPWRRR